VDDLSPLQTKEGLFSANVYLQLPHTGGGDLHIWDVEVSTGQTRSYKVRWVGLRLVGVRCMYAECPLHNRASTDVSPRCVSWLSMCVSDQVRSRWDFYRHAVTLSALTVQDLEGQKRLRHAFPKPKTIKLAVGDLVLLCAQRPHAVQVREVAQFRLPCPSSMRT
jgi:hypothetical protein